MTTLTLDITGASCPDLCLPVPEHAKARLADQGVTDIPESVTLHLREASIGEATELSRREAVARAQSDGQAFLTDLMMSRATPGTDRRVIEALVYVMAPSAAAKITHACVNGNLPNE